jgi:hypothetical protein
MIQLDGGRTEEEPCYGEWVDFCQPSDLQVWRQEIENLEILAAERQAMGLSSSDAQRLAAFQEAVADWASGVWYMPGSCADVELATPDAVSGGPALEDCAAKAVAAARLGRCFLEQWQGPPEAPISPGGNTAPSASKGKGTGGAGSALVKAPKDQSPWILAALGALLALPFLFRK